jgi:hypothetical protein
LSIGWVFGNGRCRSNGWISRIRVLEPPFDRATSRSCGRVVRSRRTLSGRLSAFYTGRAGTIKNIDTGLSLNNQNKVGARAQLYFQPGDALNLRLIADFSHQQENSGGQVLVDPGLILANGSKRPNNILVRTARFGYTPIFDPFARQANIDQRQPVETTNAGASLEANWNFAGYTLTSISAWRRWEFFPSNDMDYLPFDIQRTGGSNVWNRQLSQEIRIASPIQRSMDFVAGVFLYGQRLESATIPGATYGVDAAKFYSQPTLILRCRVRSPPATGRPTACCSIAHSLMG